MSVSCRPHLLLVLIICLLAGCGASGMGRVPPTAPPAAAPWRFVYGTYVVDTQRLDIIAASVSHPAHMTTLISLDVGSAGSRMALSHSTALLAYTRLPSHSVRGRNQAELWVADIARQEATLLTDAVVVGRYTNYPIWSPDDRYIAFERRTTHMPPYEQHIAVINRVTGAERRLVSQVIQRLEDERANTITLLDWSSDGRYLYYQRGRSGSVELWRVATQGRADAERVGVIAQEGTPRCYYVSPDRTQLLCALQKLQGISLLTIDVNTGQVRALTDVMPDVSGDPIWKQQHAHVTNGLFQGAATTFHTLTARGARVDEPRITIPGSVSLCSWSPDDTWLAGFARSDTGSHLVLSAHDGSVMHQIDNAVSHMCIGWLE